jgi:16S rRNA processing protein RimM
VLLEVGRIARPHGVRGDVLVDMVTNRPEVRLAVGSVLHSDAGDLEVVAASAHQHRWIVRFAGVDDRSGADALRGTVLRAEPLEERGTLWVHELIGAVVVTPDGTEHGEVVAVQPSPASDLLVLADDRLVPVVFVVEAGDGRIVVDPPDGLLDRA